jgi:molecular chaperone GrpE
MKHKTKKKETAKENHPNPDEKSEKPSKKEGSNKDSKIAELTEDLKRNAADFENYRKRMERDRCASQKYASEDMIKKILPVVDNFDLALQNTSNHEEMVKGVQMIHQQLMDILSKEGVNPIDCVGKQFDPYQHEALMQEECDKDKVILQEFQKGYTCKEKVLRHSKVKVGRIKKKDAPSQCEDPKKDEEEKEEEHTDE